MKPIIIGLCGAEGAGKSTVARRLTAAHQASVMPFARPLKEMLVALGVPHENLYGTPEQKEEPLPLLCGNTARWAAQSLGTNWARDLIHPDLWVNAWAAGVAQSSHTIIVADDLRFQNEAAAVHGLGGLIICVRNENAEARIDRSTAHHSQCWWNIDADLEINNNGNLNDLYRHVDRVVKPNLPTAVAV